MFFSLILYLIVDKILLAHYNNSCVYINMSPWSSGQDTALSRRTQGFDSPRRYQSLRPFEILCIQDFEGRFFIVFYWVLPSFFYYIFCRLLSHFVAFCRLLSAFVAFCRLLYSPLRIIFFLLVLLFAF